MVDFGERTSKLQAGNCRTKVMDENENLYKNQFRLLISNPVPDFKNFDPKMPYLGNIRTKLKILHIL